MPAGGSARPASLLGRLPAPTVDAGLAVAVLVQQGLVDVEHLHTTHHDLLGRRA
jgi:hypothetical protein